MHRRISRARNLAGLVGLAVLSAGCTVDCTRTCSKLLSCDLNQGMLLQAECEDSCVRQETLYELWEDEAKETALLDHQRCILGASCDELEDGACYDPDLFPFAQSES